MAEEATQPSRSLVGAEAVGSALGDLRTLVYRLADEVSTFRRRALAAETRQVELEALLERSVAEVRRVEERLRVGEASATRDSTRAAAAASESAMEEARLARQRVGELERENEELKTRLSTAAERTRQLLDRTRFLRQQQETEVKS